MMPLVPAYVNSIYKNQGATLEKVIINLEQSDFGKGIEMIGLTYTVMRCKKWKFGIPAIPKWKQILQRLEKGYF